MMPESLDFDFRIGAFPDEVWIGLGVPGMLSAVYLYQGRKKTKGWKPVAR